MAQRKALRSHLRRAAVPQVKESMSDLVLLIICPGISISLGAIAWLLWKRSPETPPASAMPDVDRTFLPLPNKWLAIKHESMLAVQSVLHLHNPQACLWAEGMSHEECVFISPCIEGWIIVTGDSIPDPSDDADISFRFLLNLSRELGEVQFFCASPIFHYHSWVKVRSGKVIRAYAWAGQTLWNQGTKTREEMELGLRTFEYADETKSLFCEDTSTFASNAEKVSRLAARWSLDLAHVREHVQESGTAGTP